MNEKHIFKLCDTIRETSYSIHRYLRNGHLEKIYENALVHRLSNQGIKIKQQVPLSVKDEDGFILGEFYADLIVEDVLIIELKAADSIHKEYIAQLLGYLRASQLEHGLLINFGAPKLEIRKFILS